jgi:hypothetical protein
MLKISYFLEKSEFEIGKVSSSLPLSKWIIHIAGKLVLVTVWQLSQ